MQPGKNAGGVCLQGRELYYAAATISAIFAWEDLASPKSRISEEGEDEGMQLLDKLCRHLESDPQDIGRQQVELSVHEVSILRACGALVLQKAPDVSEYMKRYYEANNAITPADKDALFAAIKQGSHPIEVVAAKNSLLLMHPLGELMRSLATIVP